MRKICTFQRPHRFLTIIPAIAIVARMAPGSPTPSAIFDSLLSPPPPPPPLPSATGPADPPDLRGVVDVTCVVDVTVVVELAPLYTVLVLVRVTSVPLVTTNKLVDVA